MKLLPNDKFLILLLWLTPLATHADESMNVLPDASGQVTLPLSQYQQLIEQANQLIKPAPSSAALGESILTIVFNERDGRVTATVRAQVIVETFADEWTLVELLQPGAALESASVNGEPVQLLQRADGLFWLTDKKQRATILLTYHADAHFSDRAYVTSLPIPQAAATRFDLRIPQSHIDLTVSPAANLIKSVSESGTNLRGTVSSSPAIMVTWRVAQDTPYALSRADYRGTVEGDAIAWRAAFEAEMLIDTEVTVPLVSTATTLVEVLVDGKPAMVFSEDGRFAVRIAGPGKHDIELAFQSPVTYPDGVPSAAFDIPQVPVSRFELNLPGDKLMQVSPTANVEMIRADGQTQAVFYIRMSERLQLNWMEAIPEDVAVQRRANAGIYQAVHAAEGVLYGLAAIQYEITRGEANSLDFLIPKSAQVNRITSPSAAIADWIILDDDDPSDHIRVFLNRAVKGEFTLFIAYEQLLDGRTAADNADGNNNEGGKGDIEVPLLRALDVTRQKGMVALLSGAELALAPKTHREMVEVGENQLPAFFRNQLSQAVLHTYKYHNGKAELLVDTVTPKRKRGKFNAQIDSLISIGEVTLKGLVSIENDVKSGSLLDLHLSLPGDVNILSVSGPSIRTHTIVPDGDNQRVDIEFTQEMEGQFRIELTYERIMLDSAAEITVPQIAVADADVEHGRIAIEALSVLEVQASQVEQLSSLEINELPKQLLLKTTNPILLAYKYVKTDKPFALDLRITRHEEIDVQVAVIDSATYKTLYTLDGLAVTRAQFSVRNSRRQFLRLTLPEDSNIWSVFVNGRAQKPAFASGSEGGPREVLIKMINSASAFPVELVYATQAATMRNFGKVTGHLPRPDMIVTHTNWDVYVPPSPRYSEPRSNMDILSSRVATSMKEASADLLRAAAGSIISGEPLRIELPTQGLLYRFSKLYANQSADDAEFSIRYVHRNANLAGFWLSILAVIVVWAGIVAMGSKRIQTPQIFPPALIVSGAVMAVIAIGLLGASVVPASLLALAIGMVVGGGAIWQNWRSRESIS